MPNFTTGDIRNVAFVGHLGAGKTSIVDAMVYLAGASPRRGSPADGTSVSDFEKEEKEHHHSIFSSVVHLDQHGKRVNIVDTPGAPDLVGQAISCFPMAETIVVVINAQNGIELVTRRMMDMARQRNLPRVIVINKMDAHDINLESLLGQISETFGRQCLPINLPAQKGKAVIDCLTNRDGQSDLGDVAKFHSAILDQVVESDENLMEKYLSGEELSPEELHGPIVSAIEAGNLIPICFTDARQDIGIKELLAVIISHCPSPVEADHSALLIGEGGAEQGYKYQPDDHKPLIAYIFKVATDPFVGKLCMFRVFQGKVGANATVSGSHARKGIKLARVFHVQGKEHKEIEAIIAGDIGAVAKIEDLHLGDCLYDQPSLETVHIKPISYPVPMYGLAVSPKARGDEGKISGSLARLTEEDPTFKVTHDPQTHELIINGVGELHLRMVLERLKHRGLEVDTKPPKIAYRETVTLAAPGHHRHKKQTGGAGQFGEVFLKIDPLERGKGFEFVDAIFGGSIPGQFMPAVEKGVLELLHQGYIGGYPLQDVRVTITDGKYHPVDSKEVAFKTAGKLAFRDAISKAKPVLLEPIVHLEIIVPDAAMGNIAGDLSGRRGRVQGSESLLGGQLLIKAQAPLSEVTQYQTVLKSITGGQGSYMMEFSHYEAAPPLVQQQVAAAYKPHPEDE